MSVLRVHGAAHGRSLIRRLILIGIAAVAIACIVYILATMKTSQDAADRLSTETELLQAENDRLEDQLRSRGSR